MEQTAVVILNWNGKKFLEQFLPGVVQHSGRAKVVVADNASTDDSVSFVKAHFPSVEIVQNESNGGFSKGYNDALAKVQARYYVLLNSDVEVTPGWIDPVVALMESDPSIAACQPKILDFNRREYFEYAGASGGHIDRLGFPYCRGRVFETLEKDEGQYNSMQEIFWASGACMFVRADAYHKLGGLDEEYFAHMEEIDLCWRMKNEGYKVCCCPSSTVFHVGGGTLSKLNPRKTYLNFRNSLATLVKNLPGSKLLPVLFCRLMLDGIAAFKFLFTNGPSHFWAVLRSHYAFYMALGRNLRKRKLLAAAYRDKVYKGIPVRGMVWQHYVLGKKKYSEL